MDQEKQLPVYLFNPKRGGNYVERWELSYKGSPKVCLKCFEEGHIKKDCKARGPTVSQIRQGEVTWAQVLGGQAPLRSTPQMPAKTPQVQKEDQLSLPPDKDPLQSPSLQSLSLQPRNLQESQQTPETQIQEITEDGINEVWQDVEDKRRKGVKRNRNEVSPDYLDRCQQIKTSNGYGVLGEMGMEGEEKEKGESSEGFTETEKEGKENNMNEDKAVLLHSLNGKSIAEFNKWFNEQFEKVKVNDDEDDSGYGKWIKENDHLLGD